MRLLNPMTITEQNPLSGGAHTAEFRRSISVALCGIECYSQTVMKKVVFYIVLCMLTPLSVRAVVVAGGDGSGNTSGAGVSGWDYVGRIDSSSKPSGVTYISDDWFITANHVWQNEVINSGLTSVLLNGASYAIDTSNSVRITNSVGAGVDLRLFKVTSSVAGLSGITIASSPPAVGTSITMIGSGMDRQSSQIYWHVNTSTWTETNAASANASGYKWATTKGTKRWGSNAVSSTGVEMGGMTCFDAVFDPISGEAMGATYDSGGGVFTGSGDSVELAGIMITIGTYLGQPSGTSVFGNKTYMADLSAYSDQINQVIPEPTTGILLAAVGLVFGVVKRLRYMYQ